VTDNHQEKIRNNSRAGNRRLKRRFRIEQDVRYKMLYGQRVADTGSGKTTNISSGGVCFTTDNMLSIGIPVELSMNWPVLLNQNCPLKLMIYGCVVRSSDKGSAVMIERYEFHTQGKGARRVEGVEVVG
jgi:PilZ domain